MSANTVTLKAQTGLVGFANYADLGLQGTTGGMGGKVVRVSNRADFERYAKAKEPYTIILEANLKGHYDYTANPKKKHDVVAVSSNKTIIGAGKGSRLDSLGLDINGQQNIIIRNLAISKADPDAIAIRNSHHVWVDHCDLSSQREARDENDGLLDFTYGSSYLTVSWCKFHDHDKSSICSSGTRNVADYGRQRVTYHHNSFINCTQRNPRVGYGLGHIFNDWNESNTSYAIGVFARAVVNVENCWFKDVKEVFSQMYATSEDDAYWGFVSSKGNMFEHCKGEGNSEGVDISRYYMYDFAMDEAADLPRLKDDMGCMEGIEGDIIPFPGDGATCVRNGTKLSCGDMEGAEDYAYEIGMSPDSLQPCNAQPSLQSGTIYYWRAKVIGGRYDGKVSGIFRFATAATTATYPTPYDGDQKTALRQINEDRTGSVKLSLSWREAFNAVGYTVYMGTEKDLSDASGEDVDAPPFAPKALEYGRTYYWRVDTRLGNGGIEQGEVWSFGSPARTAHTGRNEAEHATMGLLCFLERDDMPSWILASNDSCSVGDQGPGYLSFVWGGEEGFYEMTTAYFDEKSGHGKYALYVGEELMDRWTATEDDNKIKLRKTEGVALGRGNEIRLEFCTDGNMRCRTDYIDIKPSVGSSGIIEYSSNAGAITPRIFTLDGRYLGTELRRLKKGIYIVNGRKIKR